MRPVVLRPHERASSLDGLLVGIGTQGTHGIPEVLRPRLEADLPGRVDIHVSQPQGGVTIVPYVPPSCDVAFSLRADLSSSMVLLTISIFAVGCSRVHVHGVRSGASAEEVLGSLQSWHWCWPVSFRRVRSCPSIGPHHIHTLSQTSPTATSPLASLCQGGKGGIFC